MSVSGINRTSLFIPVCFILFRLQHHESTGRQRESTREQRSTLGRCWRWQPRRRPGLGHAPPDGRVAEPQIPSIPTHAPPPPAHAPPAGCSDRAQRGRRVLIRRQPSRQGWNSVVCTAKSIYWKDSSLFVQMVKARSGSSISRRNGTLWSDIPFFFPCSSESHTENKQTECNSWKWDFSQESGFDKLWDHTRCCLTPWISLWMRNAGTKIFIFQCSTLGVAGVFFCKAL